MRKILFILMFAAGFTFSAPAQEGAGEGAIRQKLTAYIKDKLSLSPAEAERFTPVFIGYFQELRQVNGQYKDDKLLLQQKVSELRLRYREQFKPIIGEKRSNDVFTYEREFINWLRDIREERMQQRQEGRANKKFQ